MAKNDTTVNGLSPVTKASGGKVIAAPDVCKTPVCSAIVPIPYPNISKSSDLAKGSKSVKINGAPVCLSTSEFSTSTGDEAGSAKGIASGTTKGKAHPVNYSFDVKIEGKSVSQVREAVKEVSLSHKGDIKGFAEDASFGYLGSVATGKVGNPKKTHKGMEPDIRGECGTFYDIDGFIISDRAKVVRKRYGKRWASSNRETVAIEARIRSSLQSRNELRHMKKGRGGFSIALYLPTEQSKVASKGCRITVR